MIAACVAAPVEAGMRGSFWVWVLILVPSLAVAGYYMWRRYRHWFR
jgi:hypothetical protein